MMNVIVSSNLYLSDVPAELAVNIKKALTLPNPAFQQAQKQGRYTRHLEPYLYFFKETAGGLVLPRGFA